MKPVVVTPKSGLAEDGLRGRPKERIATERIEYVLDVASEVFMQHGYLGTSLREIAQRARASKETLYARYPSKADLFRTIIIRRANKIRMISGNDSDTEDPLYLHLVRADRPIEEVLEAFGMELTERVLDEGWRDLCRIVLAHLETFPELGRILWEGGEQKGAKLLSNYIKGQIKQGVLAQSNPSLAADMFLAMCLGRYLLISQLEVKPIPTKAARRSFIKEAVRVFIAAYGKPA